MDLGWDLDARSKYQMVPEVVQIQVVQMVWPELSFGAGCFVEPLQVV